MKHQLFIDGELVEFTDYYPLRDCIGGMKIGTLCGSTEVTKAGDRAKNFEASEKPLYIVNVFRDNLDGSTWGIKGAFREGSWKSGPNGEHIFSVSGRII